MPDQSVSRGAQRQVGPRCKALSTSQAGQLGMGEQPPQPALVDSTKPIQLGAALILCGLSPALACLVRLGWQALASSLSKG